MIVHDSWWSNGRASFNYHRLLGAVWRYFLEIMLGYLLKRSSSAIFHRKNVFYDAKETEATNFQNGGEAPESSSSAFYLYCNKSIGLSDTKSIYYEIKNMRYLKGFFKIFGNIFGSLQFIFSVFSERFHVVFVIFVVRPRTRIAWPLQIREKYYVSYFEHSVFGNVVKRSFIFDELLLYPQVSERINLLFVSQSIIKQAPIFMSSSCLDRIDVHQSQVQSWPLTSRNVTADKYNQSENENFDPYEIWYLPNLL